jgi:hypothetical protein
MPPARKVLARPGLVVDSTKPVKPLTQDKLFDAADLSKLFAYK